MMIKFQIFIMMFLSIINLIMNIFPSQNKNIHPIIMGLFLLILLIFSSINIELYYHMNWISYLMYLIIIGGLMIIFLYFTSFISNMKMSMKWNFIKMIPIKFNLMIFFTILIILNLEYNFSWYFKSMELNNMYNMIYIKFNTMYMYMYNKSYSMIFCMIYLLVVLLFVVKICMDKKLSLRKIN